MEFETLIVEDSGEGFATLVFNRPDRLNTLSIRLRRELAGAIARLEADPAVRVLILTGAGRAFSVGLDIDEWAAEGLAAAGAYQYDAVRALQQFRGPVIGAINGLAITGGLELALACDVLLASEQARFADTHALVGLLPGWGGSVRLGRRIGLHRAKELALTGRFLSAEEARDWGLVNHVVPAPRLRQEAEAMARRMLAAVPDTVAAYKKLLDDGAAMPMDAALRLEREVSMRNNTAIGEDEVADRIERLKRRGR
jgi:enoyl-CoA hydratase